MQRTDEKKMAAIASAKELIRAAGGPRQLALQIYDKGGIAANMPIRLVRRVSQWGQRGIPPYMLIAESAIFSELKRKMGDQS